MSSPVAVVTWPGCASIHSAVGTAVRGRDRWSLGPLRGTVGAHSSDMWPGALTPLQLVLLGLVAAAAAQGPPLERFMERLASGELRLPPEAYRMSDLGEHNQTLPADLVLASETGLLEPSCRHRCLHRTDCLGTAYRPRDRLCLISGRRPLPDRLEAADEPWQLAARLGVAFLDEPCQRAADCSLAVPGSFCRFGLCHCLEAFNRTTAGGCRPLGELVPAAGVRPAAGALLREEAAAELTDCSASCQQDTLCLAAEFSADGSACRLYSAGITDDAGADPAGDWQTLVRQLPVSAGPPPPDYVPVAGRWYKTYPAARYRNATRVCAGDGGIVYPGREDGSRAALTAAQMLTEIIWVGLDDTGVEGEFVHSDGEPSNLTTWAAGEPNDWARSEDCTQLRLNGQLNDLNCDRDLPFVCQWVPGILRSAARGRPAWASWGSATAALTVDGDLKTSSGSGWLSREVDALHQPRQLTVDLGATHQMSAVLLATGQGSPAVNTTVYLGTNPWRYDAAVAAVCRRLPGQFMHVKMARLYRCRHPVQGRYLHVVTSGLRVTWAEVAVIGAPLDGDQHLPQLQTGLR